MPHISENLYTVTLGLVRTSWLVRLSQENCERVRIWTNKRACKIVVVECPGYLPTNKMSYVLRSGAACNREAVAIGIPGLPRPMRFAEDFLDQHGTASIAGVNLG